MQFARAKGYFHAPVVPISYRIDLITLAEQMTCAVAPWLITHHFRFVFTR